MIQFIRQPKFLGRRRRQHEKTDRPSNKMVMSFVTQDELERKMDGWMDGWMGGRMSGMSDMSGDMTLYKFL